MSHSTYSGVRGWLRLVWDLVSDIATLMVLCTVAAVSSSMLLNRAHDPVWAMRARQAEENRQVTPAVLPSSPAPDSADSQH